MLRKITELFSVRITAFGCGWDRQSKGRKKKWKEKHSVLNKITSPTWFKH